MSTSTEIKNGSFRIMRDSYDSPLIVSDSTEAEAIEAASDMVCDGFTGVKLSVREDNRWFDIQF